MLKVNYYQVYNNGVGKLIIPACSNKEVDRRRGIPVGAIELSDKIVNNAKELEELRSVLEAKHLEELKRSGVDIDEVAVMFSTVLVS